MANPNLVRKVSDSPTGGAGEISSGSVLSTSNKNRNMIINGDMRIAQRGTSFVSPTSGQYLMDRFGYSRPGGTMTHTVTQDTDVPTLVQSGYAYQASMRFNLTTADTSIAAGEGVGFFQRIEGYNWANLAQKSFTLSFWVKATLTGTYCVSFNNASDDRSYIAEYTINTTNTWEYKTINVSASPSAGGWNYLNGTGLTINWMIACGSTYATTANTWQTGQFRCTANQVNGANTGATDFRITGVMLNEGDTASPFRLFGHGYTSELSACQRYFFKTGNSVVGAVGPAPGTTQCYISMRYPVPMRTSPTLSGTSGTYGLNNNGNFVSSVVVPSGAAGEDTGGIWIIGGFSGLTVNLFYQLTTVSSTGALTADAEL